MKRYGICDCGKWCEAPERFNETKYFMRCECGKLMYLNIHNPIEAGYTMRAKINDVHLVKHNGE